MTVITASTTPREIATAWTAAFSDALTSGDAAAFGGVLLEDSWWRDLLAFTGGFHTVQGLKSIADGLVATLPAGRPANVRLSPGREPAEIRPDENTRWVQAFFDFEVAAGRGLGFVRLMPTGEGGQWKAWTLLTTLQELAGHPERTGPNRGQGVAHGERLGRETWSERRARERAFVDSDPDVLVVGGGQAGLSAAARLGARGVRTLIVERNARVGDNWRNRYRSLVLHDPVWFDHLAYLPFPAQWPVFTPKDKLADWFEAYVSALELNVWTGTELIGGAYDDAEGRWTVRVRRSDGDELTLRPRHLVLATGMSGVPYVPEIPGAADFGGELAHSSGHAGAEGRAGRRALVVGSCNSGHDIAQNFHEQGADVTMLQRSRTYVVSSEKGIPVFFGALYAEGGPPTDDADLMLAGFPFPLLGALHEGATAVLNELDGDLLAGLEAAGFGVDRGLGGGGLFMKYLTRGGGYYIDVGASQLIIDGKIKIKQGVEIERFTADGVVFTDGTELPADIVVLATGYQNMRESARALLGDAVADRCEPVWGLDDEGELRTIWRRSGHPGLWFMGGNLQQSRFYSTFLALQIQADLAGVTLGA